MSEIFKGEIELVFSKGKSKVFSVLFAILMMVAVSIPLGTNHALAASPTMTRLSGNDRFQTSIDISNEGWPIGSDAIVLARGDSFPDALAGATLAAAYDAPILLTDSASLPAEIQSEIERLSPSKVFILGGQGAISPSIETLLKKSYEVVRLGGNDRYETAVSIATYLNTNNLLKTDKAVISYGENFPDALAISSWAANKGVPILLSDTNSLPTSTADCLTDMKVASTIIAGGDGVISPGVASKLPSPTRYGGTDRYETAIKITAGLGTSTDKIFIATGENFPDALAGSALAARTGSAIILVDVSVPSAVSQFLSTKSGTVNSVVVLGGTGVVLPSVSNSLITLVGGTANSGVLKVSYIDVGQGDSILIQSPSGKNVLIDGGKTDATSTVENYLRASGITSLDVIATHADADHIGSLDAVIKDFTIGKVYMPNMTNPSYTFQDLLLAMQSKSLTFTRAKANISVDLGSGVTAEFLAPINDSYTDANNYSAVLKVTYGSTSFLFTGDAETTSENEMIAAGAALQSTVLKVGHHGSNSSTSDAFLNKVNPEYAVISVGDNSYGQPTEETLAKLSQHGVLVYRTDISGTIVAESDGSIVTFNATPSVPPVQSTANVKITNINLDTEVVTLENQGTGSVDLTGWKIISEVGPQTYIFPSGTTIAAGAQLRVLSGNNAIASSDSLVWTKSYIWNNTGDTGVLYNASGQEVSRY